MTAFRILILSLVVFWSCSTPKQSGISLPEDGEFFDLLSEYNVFDDLVPNEKLTKYEVTNSLFTDYAEKDRYVYIPDGQSATLKKDGFFDWPVGSMMVKNFYYTVDQIDTEKIIETRLLIKDETEWKAISYVWNDQQTEAKISKVGAVFPLTIDHKTEKLAFDYVVPNKNQCKSCHNKNEKIDPIGFKYGNLDTDISVDSKSVNQLAYLADKGIIKLNVFQDSINSMISYNDAGQDIQERALAYLDINCGHCHRPDGPGNTSGLFLQYDETRSNHLGFCKSPVAAGKGSGGRIFDIYPGHADSSILYYRMASVDPGSMMPEVGRSLTHKEGLSIVAEWINALEYDCFAQ
ncbi:SO2930 family diheme c-type cytochrome [Portibacter lacus]|uniref:Uncharacterized protein n=1 Tax=Portibacter lacus TaxID=1099794 RepID=A0AA37SPS4_9BACT|nr:SO2930 family diheme c-type cytochrome [Portibacter lacus]GLR18526.1 hypothetical protein GCM10007940_31420 [Portibacter lacus]